MTQQEKTPPEGHICKTAVWGESKCACVGRQRTGNMDRSVSFEVAKLLQRNGFNEDECKTSYDIQSEKIMELYSDNNKSYSYFIQCPTHQMAIAWLREQGIHITIDPFIEDGTFKWYEPLIITLKNPDWVNVLIKLKADFVYTSTYEEAVEASLKYSLENLI